MSMWGDFTPVRLSDKKLTGYDSLNDPEITWITKREWRRKHPKAVVLRIVKDEPVSDNTQAQTHE